MAVKTSSKLFATAVFGDAAGSLSTPGCLIYSSCGMKRLKPSICIKGAKVRDWHLGCPSSRPGLELCQHQDLQALISYIPLLTEISKKPRMKQRGMLTTAR